MLELFSPVYATALGEQRSIQFEDGSTVELNSRSKIRVKYSKAGAPTSTPRRPGALSRRTRYNPSFHRRRGATRVRCSGYRV